MGSDELYIIQRDGKYLADLFGARRFQNVKRLEIGSLYCYGSRSQAEIIAQTEGGTVVPCSRVVTVLIPKEELH